MTTPCIAVLNAGSSSLKYALYAGASETVLQHGQIEHVGTPGGITHAAAMAQILALEQHLPPGHTLQAAGHRIVHGGPHHAAPVRITPAILAELTALTPLAPLHQPSNLAPIRALAGLLPNLPQIACFNTSFHRGHSWVARSYALPRALMAEGIEKYGFHGLSYEFLAGELAHLAPDIAHSRVVLAHLGNGASLCALKDGKSIATTMEFTAVEGLVMGTRTGSLDPGVMLYLMRTHAMDAASLENLIYRQSGLLGVSGLSADMRALRASADPRARQAIDLFIYRIVCAIGSLAAAMGGLDALVFSAGIGEHDPATRAEIAAGCAWLGLDLDATRNAAGPGPISTPTSRVQAWVIPTDEERMICRHTLALLAPG